MNTTEEIEFEISNEIEGPEATFLESLYKLTALSPLLNKKKGFELYRQLRNDFNRFLEARNPA